jgi:thiol-disulfide isomerase/thioredoxin
LVIAVVLAIVLTPDEPVAMGEYGTVTISGASLPAFSGDPATDSAVGTPAPEISGVDFEGSPIQISNDGRPKVVVFLAHWCPHCQREVPAIEQYLAGTDFPSNVDFYSVATASTPQRPNWPPSAWLTTEGWSFPVVADDEQSSAFRAFGQGAFPYYVFVDAQGSVALRLSGEQDPGQLANLMESLADAG